MSKLLTQARSSLRKTVKNLEAAQQTLRDTLQACARKGDQE